MPNSISVTTAHVNAFPHELLNNEKLLNNDSDFSLYSTDCCCGRSGCDNYQTWMHIVRKLENDARLAAEIGQSLLHQHEKFVQDTDQGRRMVQQQLDGYREQIHKLEQSLHTTETAKQELDDEKNKWFWKWKRTQKTLDATAADLEIANSKWINIAASLKEKEAEVERLQAFEIMNKQSNIREDALRGKLEDAQQEIEDCRRKEKLTAARYKKIKEKHDSIHGAYERLQQSVDEDQNDENRRPNTKLRRNALKKANAERPPAGLRPSVSTPRPLDVEGKERRKNSWPQVEPQPPFTLTPSQSTPITSSTEDGSVHHHHHYYYLDSKSETKDVSELGALHSNVTRTLDRLRATDILALNRQLGRAFDMHQMSRLSNTIIEQILADTETTLVMATTTTTDDMVAIVRLYQDMIKEIGQLRTTLNDLQVEYVSKIEESGSRMEKEVMQKRNNQPSVLVAWVSNMFQLSKESQREPRLARRREPPAMPTRRGLRVSHSTGTVRALPSSRPYQQDWVAIDRRPSMMLPVDMNFRGSLSTSLLVGR
ncbi:hypothetical protein BJV82DRAFT_622297 [Fennellomyces sp. T-0311]|nr:hypothetical protein BJV82DRAFT_622297 [Fennellomyces sp. T-0311]